MSHERISGIYGVKVAGTFRAIHGAARLADIDLSDAKTGRPKGKKNKPTA